MSLNEDVKIDLSYLDEIAGGHVDFIIEMIDIFLQQTPEYVAHLKAAIDAADYKKIAEIAHKIKPTLAFIGLHKEQEAMARIEHQARAEEDYDGIKDSFYSLSPVFENAYSSLEIKKKELAAKL